MPLRPVLLALALVATAASTAVPGHAVSVEPIVMGCETGCRVVAAGWPFPFISDGFVTSPRDNADLVMAILGEDDWQLGPMAASFACWLALFAGLVRGARLARR